MSGDYMQGNRDNATIVPFSDDEVDKDKTAEDLDEDSPDASPEERLNRKQRRIQRLRNLANEGKQSKEELERVKAEQQTLKTELATLRGYVAAQPQRPANDDGKDPYERRLDAVYDRQGEAYTAAQAEIAAGTFNPERQKHYERIAREIESEKTRIHTERTLEASRHVARTEQAQQVWVQKYPEVYRDPNAFRYAQATWNQRLALGEAQSNELAEEVLTQTMTQFKLGKRAPPTASDRARMSGMPSAGGGGGARPAGIAMDPILRRMAIAAHSDLPEDEAVKKWTNTTGKKLRQKKVL